MCKIESAQTAITAVCVERFSRKTGPGRIYKIEYVQTAILAVCVKRFSRKADSGRMRKIEYVQTAIPAVCVKRFSRKTDHGHIYKIEYVRAPTPDQNPEQAERTEGIYTQIWITTMILGDIPVFQSGCVRFIV